MESGSWIEMPTAAMARKSAVCRMRDLGSRDMGTAYCLILAVASSHSTREVIPREVGLRGLDTARSFFVIDDDARLLGVVAYQEWPEGPQTDETSAVPLIEFFKRVKDFRNEDPTLIDAGYAARHCYDGIDCSRMCGHLVCAI